MAARDVEIRAAIQKAKTEERNKQGTGSRCGVCHLKRAEKPIDVPKSMWTSHQCPSDLLEHKWEDCPTQFREGMSVISDCDK